MEESKNNSSLIFVMPRGGVMEENMNKILQSGFEELGLNYTDEIEEKFNKYKELLLDWNQKINITRIENDEEIYIKHYLDSVILLDSDNKSMDKKIIDVGTGGGFPGLPLKIVNNNFQLTLLDSLRKRTDFLQLVSDTLKLENVSGELDLSSTINIVYYESKKEKAILSIDKNGLLYLYRDIDNIYKVVSKDFQYERLEELYTIYADKK